MLFIVSQVKNKSKRQEDVHDTHMCVESGNIPKAIRCIKLYSPSGDKISQKIQAPQVLPSLSLEGEVQLN